MLVVDRLVFLYLFDVFVGGYIIGEHVGVGNESMASCQRFVWSSLLLFSSASWSAQFVGEVVVSFACCVWHRRTDTDCRSSCGWGSVSDEGSSLFFPSMVYMVDLNLWTMNGGRQNSWVRTIQACVSCMVFVSWSVSILIYYKRSMQVVLFCDSFAVVYVYFCSCV